MNLIYTEVLKRIWLLPNLNIYGLCYNIVLKKTDKNRFYYYTLYIIRTILI